MVLTDLKHLMQNVGGRDENAGVKEKGKDERTIGAVVATWHEAFHQRTQRAAENLTGLVEDKVLKKRYSVGQSGIISRSVSHSQSVRYNQ